MPQLSGGDSRQFRGFLRPENSSVDQRPTRKVAGPRQGYEDESAYRPHIEVALANHPKKVNYGMFREGLGHMGVSPTPATLTHLAGLSTSNPDQFHELVGRARAHAINARDQQRAAENRRRKAHKAAHNARKQSSP